MTTIGSMVLAFILAVAIWTNATQVEDPVRTRFLEVPLQYVGLPADAVLVDADARQMVDSLVTEW